MKSFFISFFLFSHLTIIAQQVVFSEEIDFKNFKNIEGIVSGELLFVSTETEELTVFYVLNMADNSSVRHRVIRKNTHIVGHTATSDVLAIYFTSENYGSIKLECLIFSKNTQKFLKLNELSGYVPYANLCFISDNETFQSLTYNKKENSLRLQIFERDLLKDSISFTIPDERSSDFLKKNGFLKGPKTYSILEESVEASFEQALNRNKIYLRQGKIIIVGDEPKGEETIVEYVLELDKMKKTIESKIIEIPVQKKIQHNSMLTDNKLFVLGINASMINLTILDFDSGKILKEHVYNKGEPILIKQTTLKSNGHSVEMIYSNEKETLKSILRNLNKGIPVISVFARKEGDFRVLIGNQEVYSGGGAGMISGQTSTFSTPGGNITVPISGHSSTAIANSASSNSFYGYLKNPGLDIANEKYEEHGVHYKIENRLRAFRPKLKVGNHYIINSKEGTFLIFLDKKKKSLIVEEFED
jgi:hypothetical protein